MMIALWQMSLYTSFKHYYIFGYIYNHSAPYLLCAPSESQPLQWCYMNNYIHLSCANMHITINTLAQEFCVSHLVAFVPLLSFSRHSSSIYIITYIILALLKIRLFTQYHKNSVFRTLSPLRPFWVSAVTIMVPYLRPSPRSEEHTSELQSR